MPERGGPTTQSGILYQNSIASLYLGRLCDDSERPTRDLIVKVRVEAPAAVDDIVVHYGDTHTAYVQAKERVAVGDTAWRKLWCDFAAQYDCVSFIKGQDRLRFHVGETDSPFHHLHEMCARARSSSEASEWRARLNASHRALVESIEDAISTLVSLDQISAYQLLEHTEVETWPLNHIERDLVPRWMPSTNLPSHTLFRLLRDRVGGEARTRGTFNAEKLRSELASDDRVVFATAPAITELRESVLVCASLLRQHKATLGESGIHIERLITKEILSWSTDKRHDQRVALLLDNAGRGKTVIMRDLLIELEREGIVTLALKADQQLSGVESMTDLEQRLGLGEAPESAIARLAASGSVVILIDQLDALSLSLARDQRAMNVILELVARLRLIPSVTIIVSCRTFDRQTDPRLKRVEVAREFSVPLLTDIEVASVLASLDVELNELAAATIELIRTPLHLDLFASLARNLRRDFRRIRGIASLQELYGVLWDEVVRAQVATGPSASAREAVLRAVVARMHADQHTAVPASVLDALDSSEIASAGEWLTSAGILLRSHGGLSLIHQTFFDYCYARFFCQDGRDLLVTVLTSDQGLFIRPQIVQVLTFLRGTRDPRYLPTLQALLESTSLRTHLFQLTIRWFGALGDPGDSEWSLMRRLLFSARLRRNALSAIAGSVSWFARLSSNTLGELLRAPDIEIDELILPYLTSLINAKETQDAIASIALAWLNGEPPWVQKAQRISTHIRNWHSSTAASLYQALLASMPSASTADTFQLIEFARDQPIACIQILEGLFDRALREYATINTPRSVIRLDDVFASLDGYSVSTAIRTVVAAQPMFFLQTMLPWLERVLAKKNGDGSMASEYFMADFLTESRGLHSEVRDSIIEALGAALRKLASLDGDEFQRVAVRLSALASATPQELIASAYRDIAPARVDEALHFLISDSRRIRLGVEDGLLTRQVLAAIVVHLDPQGIARVERMILEHSGKVSHWNKTVDGLRWRGLDQLHLLRAIPRHLLSEGTRARLQELERKFPSIETIDHETMPRGGVVGSPIPVSSLPHMSDEAWLRAMAKYAHGAEHRDFMRGGAAQLAGALLPLVKSQPARFAELIASAPHDIDPHYSSAIIGGLAESDCSPTLIYRTIRLVALRATSETRRNIGWALAKTFERDLAVPDDILALLERWIHEQPSDDEASYESNKTDLSYAPLNTARGIALRTLLFALSRKDGADSAERRWSLLEFAVRDSSLALRATALEAAPFMLDLDRNRAIDMFEQIVLGQRRLVSMDAYQTFVYYAKFKRFVRMAPYIRHMMEDERTDTRQRGAELVVLGQLSRNGLEDAEATSLAAAMTEDVIGGPEEMRRGAARIFAHNLADYAGDECEVGLLKMVNDPSPDVRREAAWMAHRLRPEMAVSKQAFLRTFAASWAAQSVPQLIGEFLWENCALDPQWALLTIQTLLDNHFPDDGRRVFGGASSLVRAVLSIYTDPSANHIVRKLAMDEFDQLIERFSHEALNALAEWDRN